LGIGMYSPSVTSQAWEEVTENDIVEYHGHLLLAGQRLSGRGGESVLVVYDLKRPSNILRIPMRSGLRCITRIVRFVDHDEWIRADNEMRNQ
jgi:hypothetical protein